MTTYAVAREVPEDCDHPNAEDYRNRAERAEAELAEWKEEAAEWEERAEEYARSHHANLKEVVQLYERVRKLEALVCDALLEGGDV